MTESDVYMLLKDDATLNSLISGRIYPLAATENVQVPYMTYQVITGLKIQCMGGEIYQGDYRFQINVWGTTYSNVKDISEAVKSSLIGFKDSNNINISDDYDPDTLLFGQIIDFKLKD